MNDRPVRTAVATLLARPYLAVPVAFAVTAIGILSAYPFTAERLTAMTRESGWIEISTAVVYFSAALILLAVQRHDRWFFVHSAVIVALMGSRELDLHKAFTSDSVLSTRFYFRDQAQLQEKLIAGAVMIVMGVIVLYYLRYWPRLRDGLSRRTPAAISAALAIAFIPLTKFFDAFGRLMTGFGFEVDFDINMVGIVEESSEQAIPVVIVLAVAQYVLKRHTERGPE